MPVGGGPALLPGIRTPLRRFPEAFAETAGTDPEGFGKVDLELVLGLVVTLGQGMVGVIRTQTPDSGSGNSEQVAVAVGVGSGGVRDGV